MKIKKLVVDCPIELIKLIDNTRQSLMITKSALVRMAVDEFCREKLVEKDQSNNIITK